MANQKDGKGPDADSETDPETKELKEEEEKLELEEPFDGVPKDTGWSWVICITILLNMSTITGFNRAMSVLFMDFVEQFDESATVISLLFTFNALFGSIATIMIPNILMKKFSVRAISVMAALFNGLATVAISLAPNIAVFLLLFAFKGLFFGTLLLTPMSLIGFYFKKRRALATSITNAGFCIGYIAFPPFTDFLRNQFGVQGCLLIIAGVELQLIVVNMLLRSVESYRKLHAQKVAKEKLVENLHLLPPIYKGAANGKINTTDKAETVFSNMEKAKPAYIHSLSHDPALSQVNGVKEPSYLQDDINPEDELFRQRSRSDAAHLRLINGDGKMSHENGGKPHLFSSAKELHQLSAKPSTLSADEIDICKSQLSIVSVTELPFSPVTGHEDKIKEEEMEEGNIKEKRGCGCSLSSVIDTSLFKVWRFRMLMVFYVLAAFSNYLIMYMPAIAQYTGVNKTDAAMLMTMSGVMDLLTRIASGFIADFSWVSQTKLVLFSMLVLTLVCQLSRFYTSFELFVMFAILVGVFSGFRQNFLQVWIIEYLGVEKLAKGFGAITTVTTLSISINHPVIGKLLDSTGSFVVPLHYIGAMMFLSAIVLGFEPLFKKWDIEKKEEEEKKKNLEKQAANA